MKKIIFTLFALFMSINVYAENQCTVEEISAGKEALRNVGYDLEYVDNLINIEGNKVDGYFKFSIPTLPEGYNASLTTQDYFYEIESNNSTINVYGGIYNLEFYSNDCDSVVYKYQIKIPFYKQFCDLDKECNNNVWFDGTYENTASNQDYEYKPKASKRLIAIIVVLILIIVLFIVVLLKRRRSNEEIM